jgi:hypothetical protein
MRFTTILISVTMLLAAGKAQAGNAVLDDESATSGRTLQVLALLGEWFGDAWFALDKGLANRGWEVKAESIP